MVLAKLDNIEDAGSRGKTLINTEVWIKISQNGNIEKDCNKKPTINKLV